MKRYLVAASILVGFLGVTGAEATQSIFIGRIVFTGSSGAACIPVNPVGERQTIRFMPAGIDNNGVNSIFTLYWRSGGQQDKPRSATSYTLASNSFDGTPRPVKGVIFENGPKNFVNTPVIAVTSVTQNNASLDATTQFVSASGEIQNWQDELGCTVSFTAAFTKQLRN